MLTACNDEALPVDLDAGRAASHFAPKLRWRNMPAGGG